MSVNKVILVGYLGKDPEVRTFEGGGMVANCSLATSERWKDKSTGEMREHTEWHRLVFNDRLAEIAGQYLKKGSLIYVDGTLRTRKWKDAETGAERSMVEVRVSNMKMLGGKDGGRDGGNQSAAEPLPAAQKQQAQQPAPHQGGNDFADDDIPF